ncbi:protein kinase [Candidatus Berkiella cookevillensis]|uniref:Protein kinase n=1 Tax=Candidatus Berkiella cookevillensis TaxID=437022 RepID=A0A0Q9YRU1_9GAMM|nr:protein kinase [Candidatus Berkiella cookevillensis]MCS5707531.1 protein kinase [Candidatus Berkiella cookevillensis]
MPIPLSPQNIGVLQAQGISEDDIRQIQASNPPADGSFYRIALSTPLSRQFKGSDPENQEFVLVNGKPFLIAAGLGKGGFGSVYQGISLETGEAVAIKFSNIPRALGEDKAKIVDIERESLRRLGKLQAGASGPSTVMPEYNYAALTVMTLVQGQTLEQMLYRENDAGTMEKQHLDMLTKFFIGMEFIDSLHSDFHQNGILHRDIKPDNIFWNSATRKLSIIDYGENLHVQGPIPDNFDALHIPSPDLSNMLYAAPELAAFATRAFSAKSDSFAAGLVLAEVFSDFNAMAFKDALITAGDSNIEAEEKTQEALRKALMAPGEDAVSKVLFAAVVNNILQADPNKRGTLLDASIAIKKCTIGFLNKSTAAELGITETEKAKLLSHLRFSIAMNNAQLILENNRDFIQSHRGLSEALNHLVTTTRQRDLMGDNSANDRQLFAILQTLEKKVNDLSDRKNVAEKEALLSLINDLKSEPKMLLLQTEQFMQQNTKFLTKLNLHDKIEMLTTRYAHVYEAGLLQDSKVLQVISNNIGAIQADLDQKGLSLPPQLSQIFAQMHASLKLPEAVVRKAEDVTVASSSVAEPQQQRPSMPSLSLEGLSSAKAVSFAAPEIRRGESPSSKANIAQDIDAPPKRAVHEPPPSRRMSQRIERSDPSAEHASSLSRRSSTTMFPSFIKHASDSTTSSPKTVQFQEEEKKDAVQKPTLGK